MDVKFNINKIHGDLLKSYPEVLIEEKANSKWGQFFQVEVKKDGKTCRCVITKESINLPTFNWGYFDNPTNEDSNLVARQSDIFSFTDHIEDIFEKNRFSKDYLQQINKD